MSATTVPHHSSPDAQMASNLSDPTSPPPVTSPHPSLPSCSPVSHGPGQGEIPSRSFYPISPISSAVTLPSSPALASSRRSPLDLPTKVPQVDAGLPPRPTTQPNDFLIEHSRRPILALKPMTPMPATKAVAPCKCPIADAICSSQPVSRSELQPLAFTTI
jgi:hypothetical protein